MQQIRGGRRGARRERPGPEILSPDPRNPDVVRAKALAREASCSEVRHEPDVGQVRVGYAGQAFQVQPANGRAGSAESTANHLAVAGSPATLLLGPDLPCRQDPDLFFAESPQDVKQAKTLCRGCRARTACLTKALERREPWGVWGGELLMRGAIVPVKRPRGRPRKTEVAA